MTAWPPSLITATTHKTMKTMKTMKTTLNHAHDLTHAERSAVLDSALLVATDLRPATNLGALPADARLRPARFGFKGGVGQEGRMAGKRGACTPACTGCMSGQMAYAREVAGVAA